MDEKQDWMRKYISVFNKCTKARCNRCGNIYNFNNSKISAIKVHLFRAHEIYDKEDNLRWKNDTNDVIWQYFSKQNKFTAHCNVANCKALIRGAYKKQVLARHLYRAHRHIIIAKREEIARTWLSRHFRFTNWNATCRHCDYSINIFRGTDDLRSHLIRNHDIQINRINKYSRCKEKTGYDDTGGVAQQFLDEGNYHPISGSHDNDEPLGNQEGQQSLMLQQSVDEKNYGPSSHHDNTPRKSLGNKENQCLMLQQSVDEENSSSTSSHYNRTQWQSFGNLEGQQGLMSQQSVGEENSSSTSSHYNRTQWQSFGNIGQQGLMLQQSVGEENSSSTSSHYNRTQWQSFGNIGQQGNCMNFSLMSQQSVGEENSSSTSSHYNRTQWQSFGNIGQQGLMLQQSVGEENSSSTSSHYNRTQWQSFGNIGQQGLMSQQSVGEENSSSTSSHYNRTQWQSFGNIGQQGLMLQQSVGEENSSSTSSHYNRTQWQSFGNLKDKQGSVDNYSDQQRSEFDGKVWMVL